MLNAENSSPLLHKRSDLQVDEPATDIIEHSVCQCICNESCSCVQRLVNKIFPPRGRAGQYATRVLICVTIWATLYCIIGKDALPHGNIFAIYILLVLSSLGGFFTGWNTKWFNIPPLLGMMIVGFLLRNLPGMAIATDIHKKWSSSLRSIALVVILIRSGLGLDTDALKRLKCTMLRLSFGPCLAEAVTVAIVSHLLLGLPWLWSFQLGFILGAVSPAVVVPSMLNLQTIGYGVKQGIPTLVMAASSCDDVLAISLFGIFLGVSFSEGNLIFNIFRGPLELIMGIFIGMLTGVLLWYFPNANSNAVSANRVVLLFCLGLLSVFGSNAVEFSGAGALGVLTLAITAGYGWGEEGKASVEKVMSVLWDVFQPLLFGLIGAEISIAYLDKQLVGLGFATLLIGLLFRISVTYIMVGGNGFTRKEKIFCALAWLPKATVQAAIGSIPLDTARDRGFSGKYQEELGIKIVTIAVLVILITAPLGAIGISLAGPRFLQKIETPHISSSE